MKKSENSTNKKVLLLASAMAIIGMTLLSFYFDFYYDLNDDILIKDILSGQYTGIPEAHNNQILYPMSILISGLYRIVPNVPWLGILEILVFLISYILITYRFLISANSYLTIILRICSITAIMLGCYLWELTNIQYTVVSGMLATMAAVWLYTSEENKGKKSFLVYNIPTCILCVLSFNLRSELFLLLTPMLAMIGLAKWSKETKILSKDNLIKYLGTVGIIGVLLLLTVLIDNVAYSKSDWKEYREFFDARTRVYDITGIPQYDSNQDFYKANGITEDQIDSLLTYNWARNDTVDADMLNVIADYVESGGAISNRSPIGIKGAIREYIYHATDWESNEVDLDALFADDNVQHNPMNIIVVVLYVCVLLQAFYSKDRVRRLFVWGIMVVLRSIPWIYLYTTQRVITRITHPLYMLEIILLLYMVFDENHSKIKNVVNALVALIVVMSVLQIPVKANEIIVKQNMRQEQNRLIREFMEMAEDNPDTYYYLDVYSTVSFTERIFDNIPSKVNWQLDGGWIAKSPLDAKKQNDRQYLKICLVTLSEDRDKWVISEIE